MREKVMPNDVVLHKPSGEMWSVAGVCHEDGMLVPKGYPFPSMAKIGDCVLIERRYEDQCQEENVIVALMRNGMFRYVDNRSLWLREERRRKSENENA